MSEYTKGPWVNVGGWVDAKDKKDGVICSLGAVDRKDETTSNANANLIAAAPDLMEACEEFVRKCESGEVRSKRSYQQMKAAISKAKGDNQ